MRFVADARGVLGAGAQGDVDRAGLDRVAHQVPHGLGQADRQSPTSSGRLGS
jgi:hypothetical protein